MIEREDYITEDVATPINDVCKVYVDYFWWCEYGDPKRAVIYKGVAPQCNSNRKILEGMEAPYKECKITQIPVAYRKWNG